MIGLAVGSQHGCAVLENGAVECFGQADGGLIGDPELVGYQYTPVTVAGVSGATEISVGKEHACAQTSSGTRCWGGDSPYLPPL